MPANTWIEISKSAIINNINVFKKINHSQNSLCAVIKANAYGHKATLIAQICLEQGITTFAVNSIEEYIELLNFLPTSVAYTIIIMGACLFIPDQTPLQHAVFVVSNTEQIRYLSTQSGLIHIHLKVDSGLSRLGCRHEDIQRLVSEIDMYSDLKLTGLMSHFANVEDVSDTKYMQHQLDHFNEYANQLPDKYQSPNYKFIKHMASSASSLIFPQTHLNMIRIGISLYGFWPSALTRLSAHSLYPEKPVLKRVLTWKTRIVHINHIPALTPVGYGCTFVSKHPLRIAVIPVGYYEGYDRRFSSNADVLIHQQRASVIGRICMNMTIVDITHIENAGVGSEVVLLGQSGTEEIQAEELANKCSTIHYEITTRLNERIERVITE